MESIARTLVLAGVVMLILGGAIYLAGRFDLPIGRLPGDIRIEGKNGSFYFPLTSSILVSVVLTIVLNLIRWILRR